MAWHFAWPESVVLVLVSVHELSQFILDDLTWLFVHVRVELYAKLIYIFGKAGCSGLLAVVLWMDVLHKKISYLIIVLIHIFTNPTVFIPRPGFGNQDISTLDLSRVLGHFLLMQVPQFLIGLSRIMKSQDKRWCEIFSVSIENGKQGKILEIFVKRIFFARLEIDCQVGFLAIFMLRFHD